MCIHKRDAYRRMLSTLVWLVGAAVVGSADRTFAKSIYLLSDLSVYPCKIAVYNILGPAEVALKGEYTITQEGGGAVGVAFDSRGESLFLTYEDIATVKVVSANTFKPVGEAPATGATNLAGIVYDHDKRLLYCVDRFKEDLYVFEWDSRAASLLLKAGSPFKLAGSYSLGIALDEIRDLLYATSGSDEIRVYQTSDWSLVKTIKLKHPAISVAIDFDRQSLYTAAGYRGDLDLVRYDLASGVETSVEVDPKAGAIGITVDNETGLVYITTGRDNDPYTGNDLKVYSPSLELLQSLHLGGNPTGLVVPLSGFGLNPLGLRKRVVSGTQEVQGIHYAHPGDTVTYEVCFDNNGNRLPVIDVVVEDALPAEVNFVRVEDLGANEGTYNTTTHTFLYRRGILDPNATGCFHLVVQVKDGATAGAKMTNRVVISSRETESTAATSDVTVAYDSLRLSKRVVPDPNHVVVGDVVYVTAGSTMTYEVVLANPDNAFQIPEVLAVDTLPDQVDFVAADGDDGVGYYDPTLRAYSRVYTVMDPGAVIRFQVTVRVHTGLPAGTIITNSVLVNGLWTPPTVAQAQAVIKYNALNISKKIVAPVNPDGGPASIGIGQTVTYRLCVDNNDNEFVTHNISVIDALPAEVDFLSADSGGIYDPISRSCSWVFESLLPWEKRCAELVVRVNSKAVPHQAVANTVFADSNETPPVEASVQFITSEIALQVLKMELIYSNQVCKDCSHELQAVLTLPPEVRRSDVNPNEMLVLDPGGVRATSQIVYGYDGKVKIRAFFDIAVLSKSADGYGRVTVTVKGWLRSGRAFVGQDNLVLKAI